MRQPDTGQQEKAILRDVGEDQAFTLLSLGLNFEPLLFTDTGSQAWKNILLHLQVP